MFDKLYKQGAALDRHGCAPFADERQRYLSHCAQQGYSHRALREIAIALLWAAREFSAYPELKATSLQIQVAAGRWTRHQQRRRRVRNSKATRRLFRKVATRWLQFLGDLAEPIREHRPFTALIDDFAVWMKHERGLSPVTIQNRRWYLDKFLRWYVALARPISKVQITDVDAFLAEYGKRTSRITTATSVAALKAFFKYAGIRGWCPCSIAEAIQAPRVFAQENVPSGPAWQEVRRLLASMDTADPFDIRDRAIAMLFAIYGLRSSEVSQLKLEDIDWEHDQISVWRPKQRRRQTYPLIALVGNAVGRYLQEVRPPCSWREIFLTIKAPLRPTSHLYNVISRRMSALGICTRHRGPHALRHACAAHLIAQGFSLQEIGDHLGHRSSSSTEIYAKVDLPSLRKVAEFDLGGLS